MKKTTTYEGKTADQLRRLANVLDKNKPSDPVDFLACYCGLRLSEARVLLVDIEDQLAGGVAMKTQRSNHPFCANCGKTALLHAYPESSCAKYITPGSREAKELEATKVEAVKLDSGAIDNRLAAATNEWLQAKIAKATLHLRVGLSMPKDHPSREKQFDRALKALGSLGAS